MQSRLVQIIIVCGLSVYANASGILPDSVKEITTKSGVCMVYLPSGTFVMGDKSALKDATPPHNVTVSPFYIDKFEVTQEMYESLMGSNPSKWSGKKNPVECIRWKQAILYCNARSKKEGLIPCYNETDGQCDFTADGYRLPTEAEWEYACRAGSSEKYSFGDNSDELNNYAWYKGNSEKKPRPAGQKKPNALGLYDMHGNVWEWCNDYYDPNYYQNSTTINPLGPVKKFKRVLRGGSWKNNSKNCTSAYRLSENPACSDICLGYDDYGFRCVRNAYQPERPVFQSILNKTELKNDRICIRVSPADKKVEFCYKQQDQWIKAGEIVPVSQESEKFEKLSSFSSDGNNLTIRFTTQTGKESDMTFLMNNDYPFIETRPGEGVKRIAVNIESSYGITPDLFANDLVFDSNEYSRSPILYPPSEHCFVNLLDNGNAMLLFLWPSLEQKIGVYSENGRFKKVEVEYRDRKSVFVGLLSKPGIWHCENAQSLNVLEEKKLNWKVPFPARWCINYKRTTGLMETFGSLNKKDNQLGDSDLAITNQENHTVWVSARGGFIYPFYIDGINAYVRLPKFSDHEEIVYMANSPILIYPFEKIEDTSASIFTPFDVIRLAFENTSDSEVYKNIHVRVNPKVVYPTTCAVTEKIEEMFSEHQENQHYDEIAKQIKEMDMFVLSIRERVDEYVAWSNSIRDFCMQKAKADAEVNEIALDMVNLALQIETKYAEIKKVLKSPSEERMLSAQILKMVNTDDPNKLENVQLLCREIRTIGGTQDWMVGYCRQILSEMHQRSGISMTTTRDGSKREFLEEIRNQIHEFTKYTFFHESGIEGSRR